jgi:hypothetical protein
MSRATRDKAKDPFGAAARGVASVMRVEPALNGGQPVAVTVTVPSASEWGDIEVDRPARHPDLEQVALGGGSFMVLRPAMGNAVPV